MATITISVHAMEHELTDSSKALLINDSASLTENTLDIIQEQKKALSTLEDNQIDSLSDRIKNIYLKGKEIFVLQNDETNKCACTGKNVCKVCLMASCIGTTIFALLSGTFAAIGACTGHGAEFACHPCIISVSSWGSGWGYCSVCGFYGYKRLAATL